MRVRTLLAAALLALGLLVVLAAVFRQVLEGPRGRPASSTLEKAAADGGTGRASSRPASPAAGVGSGVAGDLAGGAAPGTHPKGSSSPSGGDPSGPGVPDEGVGLSSADGGGATGASPAPERPLGKGDATIVVIVTDPDGRPFAGVEVEINGAAGTRTQPTDKNGSAELAGIPAGSYEVRVRPPEATALRSTRPADVAAGERLEIRCMVPAFDAEIAGRVLDEAGEPVAGIEVEARPIAFPGTGVKFTSSDAPPPIVTSDGDGAFRFAGLARVEHSLTTHETPRYPPARAIAVAGSAEAVDIAVSERRGLTIEGTVMDPEGTPVPGVQVSVLTHPAGPGTSDRDGKFKMEVKYERGAVVLSARKDGFAPTEGVITALEIGDQETMEASMVIEPLGKTGELRGLVADSQGNPIPRQMVRIHSLSINANYQGVSGEDGEYAIREVRIAPDYRAWVNPERGWRDFAQEPFEIAEGTTRLDIVLDPLQAGRLSGRMVDPAGRPVPRLTLWARSLSASSNITPATSDDQGRFTMEEAPAGDLRFETRATPLISIQGIRLEPGESQEVELLIGLGQGRLDGLVTASGGKVPIAGARLTLSWSGSRGPIQSTVYREVTSDAQGRFSFSGLSRGRGSLIASAPGYMDHRETRELTGEAEDVRIEMTRS